MRISSLAFVAVVVVGPAGMAHADRAPVVHQAVTASAAGVSAGEPLTLGVLDIDDEVQPIASDIRRCYLAAAADARGAGQLDVKLVIRRNGTLAAVDVATPGLPARLARKIDSCVRSVVEPLQFPARKASTTAVVPFLFQRTAAPNSGPQLSCWNPRGCRS